MNLMFRQDPGKINAMSSTKINFPTRMRFTCTTRRSRACSISSCGSNPRAVSACRMCANSTWLLRDTPGWSRRPDRGDDRNRARTPKSRSSTPVPVYFTYFTAWASGDGIVQFRDDIQKRARSPAARDRADRFGEHRLAGGAGSAGLGPDQQICRGLSGPPLLWRLRVRRHRRESRHRARQAAVRLPVSPMCSRIPGSQANQAVFLALLKPATRSSA
jgi:hypothetical protein